WRWCCCSAGALGRCMRPSRATAALEGAKCPRSAPRVERGGLLQGLEEAPLLVAELAGDPDLQLQLQVAALALLLRQALALEPQLLAALRARGDGQLHLAVEGGEGHLGAEGRLPGRHRQARQQVVPVE